jgi:hypothetical protein
MRGRRGPSTRFLFVLVMTLVLLATGRSLPGQTTAPASDEQARYVRDVAEYDRRVAEARAVNAEGDWRMWRTLAVMVLALAVFMWLNRRATAKQQVVWLKMIEADRARADEHAAAARTRDERVIALLESIDRRLGGQDA